MKYLNSIEEIKNYVIQKYVPVHIYDSMMIEFEDRNKVLVK